MTSSWNGYRIEIFKDDLSPIGNQVHSFFKEFSVPHIVKNVVHDPEARRDFKLLNLQLVPSFIIGGRVYEGYDPILIGELVEKFYDIKIPNERLIIDIPLHRPWFFEYDKKIISLPKL
ncbi:hypothetical protein [Paenibacillus ehimensis]|uniref:Glutaredoxin domain-containing protein n=1 Tax=Paenibacillus ehimensis TaxID=79264 RepID=A0ABT8VCE5_9BACL|nr:hypothetical protein [Paenibacillus ehimensis]MDO3678629.1 hypothetical protein [Paenibacillus ehimensis]